METSPIKCTLSSSIRNMAFRTRPGYERPVRPNSQVPFNYKTFFLVFVALGLWLPWLLCLLDANDMELKFIKYESQKLRWSNHQINEEEFFYVLKQLVQTKDNTSTTELDSVRYAALQDLGAYFGVDADSPLVIEKYFPPPYHRNYPNIESTRAGVFPSSMTMVAWVLIALLFSSFCASVEWSTGVI
jgi:hypothetical protein